jgi:hypothetical protein
MNIHGANISMWRLSEYSWSKYLSAMNIHGVTILLRTNLAIIGQKYTL